MPTRWMPPVLIATWLVPLVAGIDLQVEENQPPGTLVGNIFSVLPIDFGALLYVLPVDGSPNDRDDLLVDLTSGEIRTAQQLDREKQYLIELLAVATSGRSMKVHVVVIDINDHTPSFPTDTALLTVPEAAPVGSRLVLPAAQDPDAGKFGLQGYSIRSANPPGGFFSLEWAASGGRAENPPELVLQRQLDRETGSMHLLELEASDGGFPPRRGVLSVKIDVLDVNDNHPTFSQPRYEAWVAEGSLPGTSVIQVFATDPDDGKNGEIHYSINRRVGDQEACFEVDSETGVVRLHRRLDFEFKHQHEIIIEARDDATEPEVSSAILTVHVRNTNDHPPTISLLFLGRGGQPAISEAAQPGDLVARVSVSDPDKVKNFGGLNGDEDGHMEEMAAITEEIPVSVSDPDSDKQTETLGSQPRVWLTGGEDRFGLRATEDGAIYLVVVSAVLDREVRSSYDMTVWAEDGGSPPLQTSQQFILFVEDQNDNPPLWNQKVYRAIVPENVPVGTLVLSVEARDADVGENGKLSYQLLYEGADDGTLGDSFKVKHPTDSHWSDGRHNSSGFSLIDGHHHKTSESGIFDLHTETRNVSPRDKSSPMADWFSIDPGSGVIRTAARLDHQLAIRVRLRAIAVDGGHPKLSASVPVIISVEDSGSEIVAVTRYNVTVREGTPAGSCFLQVYAADSGIKESQHVQFKLGPDVNGQSPSAQFRVHLSTGEVCLARALPRDRGLNTYTFSVRLEHKNDLLSLAHIEVDVQETNDHHPVFSPVTYKLHMTAPGRTGLILTKLSATDADGGHLGHVTYSLVQGENNVGHFILDPESGVLSLASPLPSDSPPTLQLLANAHDGGGLSAETLAHISIVLRGKSDSRASPSDRFGGVIFANLPYKFSVSVDVPAGTLVGAVSASGSLGETVQYLLSEGDPEGVLILDPISGMLRTTGRKACCENLEPELRVTAWVPGRPASASMTSVHLTILRDDKQPPRFLRNKGHVLLSQTALPSDGLFYSARAQVQGRDSARYIQYNLLRDPGGLFFVNAQTGGVHLLKKDDVPDGSYEVLLEARDGRQPALATPFVLMVNKLPSSACDLHWPGLAPYRVRVRESVQPGTTILHLQALGLCPGMQPYYHLLSSPATAKLRLGMWTGVLSVLAPLDHEKDSQLALTVQVHDGFGHYASLDLDIDVQDSNDNKPRILDGVGPHLFSVPENGPIGLPVGRVKAYDPDAGHNGQLTFSLRSQPESPFHINPNTGELVTTQSLNRESCTFYRLTAVVSDLGSPLFSATSTLLVEVLDENDNSPSFYPGQDTLEVLDVSPPGTWLATRSAFDPDAGINGTFSFSLLPSDGSEQYLLDSQTGELRTAEILTRSSYSLRLEVHDGGTPPLRTEALLQIKVIFTSNYRKSTILPVLLSCPPLTSPGTGIGTLPLPEGWYREPGRVNFTLMGGPETGHFVVERTSGKVFLSSLAPVPGRYHLDVWIEGVVVSEKPQESYIVASVAVLPAASPKTIRLDWPNNGPLELMVSEEVPLGHLIHTFSALPADYSIRYGLLGNPVLPLAIDAASGELRTTDLLDREETSLFDFVVTAELINKGFETFLPVKLHVSDVNDNAPYWRSQVGVTRESWIGDQRRENWRSQKVEVLEDEPPGSPLACLVAHDPDAGESGHVSYALIEGNEKNIFSVDENFGVLYLSKMLDRERRDSYQLVLSATDKGTPPQTAYLPIEVLVLDINEPPEFTSGTIKASVVENCLPRCFVTQLQAQDRDLGENGNIRYALIDNIWPFQVDGPSGVVSTTQILDREAISSYQLQVMAVDGGKPALTTIVDLFVEVLDENEEPPKWMHDVWNTKLPENHHPVPLIAVLAHDRDAGPNGTVTYRVLGGDDLGEFDLDPHLGILSTVRPLNHEACSQYNLVVEARDGGVPPRFTTATVEISVADENDHEPSFPSPSPSVDIPEDSPPGTSVVQLQATDHDSALNANLSYTLGLGAAGYFTIDMVTGMLTTALPLDRETNSEFSFLVFVSDRAPIHPRSASTGVTVRVTDVNDNDPVFNRQLLVLTAGPDLMPYSPIGQLQAQDPDFGPGGSVVYRLGRPDPLLVVNAATGELSLREVPLSPSDPHWPSRPRWLPLVAADHGEPPRSRTAMVLLHYGYRDDGVNQEQIWKDQVLYFEKEHYKATLQENTSPGTVVMAVKAVRSARSMGRRVVYSLASISDTFTINSHTGQIEVLSSLKLDYEKRRRFDLLVGAETKGSKHGEQVEAFSLLTVYVTEVNDSPPSFILPVFTASISEDLLPGTEVTKVSAVDPDRGAGGDVEYKLLGDQGFPFKLDSQSGILTTNALVDRELQAYYSLQVTAVDKGWPQHTSSAVINISVSDVNDNLPILQPVDPLLLFEDLSPGSTITRLSASDIDLWPPLMFSLDGEESETSRPIFMVEPWDGTLVLLVPLVNRSSTLELTLRVSDEDHEVTTQLIITIRKKNHYSPMFSQSVYKASVSESALPGTMVLMVTAADKDTRENGKLSYRLLHQSRGGFSVDASTGQILTTSHLHYSSDNPEVLLVLEACDEEKPPHVAVTILMVMVRPKIGLGLQFNQNSYSVSASKRLPAGAQLATVSLTSSAFSSTDFFVAGQGQLANAFMLVRRARAPNEAHLVATREVNFEAVHGSDTLTLIACNRNDPAVNGTANLMLHIQSTKKTEVNFKDIVLKVHIQKTMELGEEILQLSANGPVGFTYQIIAGNKDATFELNPKTGALSLNKRLNYVTQNEYELLVSVKPPGQQVWSKGGPIGLSLARVLVVAANELSHTPSFAAPQFHVGVREGMPPTPLLMLQAGDADQGLRYSLREEPGQRGGLAKLSLNPTTGQVSTREPLDFETQRSYMVRVQAHTSHGLQAETSLSVWVHGQDEFDPVFTQTEYHFAVPEGARAGQIVGQVSARDRDAGLDGLVRYTLPDSPTFLLIDQYSGELHLAVDAGKAPHPGPRVILVSIHAAGSRTGARTSLARVRLDLTATGLGLGSRPGTGLLGPILAGFLVAAGLMLLGGLIAAVAVCMRHKRPLAPPASKPLSKSEPALSICDGSRNPYEYSPPGYAAETDWEDAEIRMITESRRSGDGPGRVPDSGIQQDEDQLSETSGHSDKVDVVVGPVFGESTHSPTSSPNRVSAFVQVQASVVGGKTAGLMIEDWEKLLDWGPQFKTLAGVLFEISGLWDERLGLPVPADHPGAPRTRIMPPPLLTSVAQPGARCVPPRPLYTRTNLLPMPAPPASPFVHSSSPPDVARQVPMTPRLSPAMSPLPSHLPPASPRPLGLLPCTPNLGTMQEHPELCM